MEPYHMTTPGFPDFMLDIETTGTDPSHSGILQIACVAFNIETKEVDPVTFNRSLVLPNNRFWDEDTRHWWAKRADTLRTIQANAVDAKTVLEELQQFVTSRMLVTGNVGRPWAKPISFDMPMIESYYRQFDVISPFSFRDVVDMRTYIRTKLGTWDIGAWEKSQPSPAGAHNALVDCFYQLKMVFNAG